jgi:site-specific DNA-methyltransferase (adenine-specific)
MDLWKLRPAGLLSVPVIIFLKEHQMKSLPINQIIAGECAGVMSGFPDACIDLVVTSPPYDDLRHFKGCIFDFEKIAGQLYRILKPGGVIVWVVGDQTLNGSETGTSFRQALHFMGLGLNLHDTMIYHRQARNCMPKHKRYYQDFEYMFVFSKGKPKAANLIKDRKNKSVGTKTFKKNRAPSGEMIQQHTYIRPALSIRPNIWKYANGFSGSTTDPEAFDHPAIFPEKLAQDHILTWSNPGDIVLDPMNGSGTTTKMAKYLHRQYIGIDESPEYCEIARSRLTDLNGKLFVA